jgi:hypothetical protein
MQLFKDGKIELATKKNRKPLIMINKKDITIFSSDQKLCIFIVSGNLEHAPFQRNI